MKVKISTLRNQIRKELLSEKFRTKYKGIRTATPASQSIEDFEFPFASSKSINDVDDSSFSENFRSNVIKIMEKLRQQGYDPIIGSAFRTPEEQEEKIRKGYSKTKTIYGKHVALNEKGEKAALAVDLVQKNAGWSNTQEAFNFFEALGKIVNEEYKDKIIWGGNWSAKDKEIGDKTYRIGWDPAHIESKTSMKNATERTMKGIEALKK